MKYPKMISALCLAALATSLGACNDEKSNADADGGGGRGGSVNSASLCAKYGGAANVAQVVSQNVILDSIAADCRISAFFTMLSESAFHRVNDCLTIQVQELFGCDGIHYEGAKSRDGLVCRSMLDAHAGVGISDGDFDALIEDVVKGLQSAGVEQADIDAAAPALLGLRSSIVEQQDASNDLAICSAGGAGGAGGGAP